MNPVANLFETDETFAAFEGADTAAEAEARRTLRCVVMQRDLQLPPALVQAAENSRHDIRFDVTHSPATTRAAIDRDDVDLILLDHRVDAEGGLELARDLTADGRTAGTPVVMMTDDQGMASALDILRAGAVDCLDLADLDAGMFDQAVENALRRGRGATADHLAVISNLEAELAGLRRTSLRNMRLLKSETLPLLGLAWQSLKAHDAGSPDYQVIARRLSRITRTVTGLIDDTVITSATYKPLDMPVPVDLGEMVAEIVSDDCSELRASRAHFRIGDLPVISARRPVMAMMIEEMLLNLTRNSRFGHVPDVEIGCAADTNDNPILWFKDQGVPLSVRKQALAKRASIHGEAAPVVGDSYSWSLCQRLAEKNGGEFKLSDSDDGSVRIAIRFPKSLLLTEEQTT
ncbi:MAG: response regulator [Pseudomonadota bacterium]